jgi:hypothetical protein
MHASGAPFRLPMLRRIESIDYHYIDRSLNYAFLSESCRIQAYEPRAHA